MGSVIANFAGVSILYDPDLLDQPKPDWFDPTRWPRHQALGEAGGGRGPAFIVENGVHSLVLRHFYRGGLPGKLLRDSYIYTGRDRTRSFREFRLLQSLHSMGLPVPQPAAAQVVKRGLFYSADLLTLRLDGVASLAELDQQGRMGFEQWGEVGAVIRRFHDAGAYHADLNAANIQLDASKVWLLDFDRGCFRSGDHWKAGNLDRLLRSLNKKWRRSDPAKHEGWRVLLGAYDSRRA